MAELIVGKLLDATDAFLIKELHIVTGIAIQEVIGTHAEPEQTDLFVGILCLVVDVGNVGRGKRAIGAEV